MDNFLASVGLALPAEQGMVSSTDKAVATTHSAKGVQAFSSMSVFMGLLILALLAELVAHYE